MSTFFQQTAQAMIAKHIDRFPLLKLDQVIDWQPIEQYLNRQKNRYLRDHRGRPAYPLLSMFKAVLLGQWHSLSDPELEHSLIIRIDFNLFCRFDELSIPDYSTLCRYRNWLAQDDTLSELLELINRQLTEKNLKVEKASAAVIDATIIQTAGSKQRQAIEVDEEGQVSGQTIPSKDSDARWIKKNGLYKLGYKQHTRTDAEGYIEKLHITPANTHECNHLLPLLEGIAEDTTVYADKGYDSEENRQHLEEHRLLDGNIAQVRHALAALTGQPAQALDTFTPNPATTTPAPPVSQLTADLLGKRPDLAAQREALTARRHLVASAKTEFYPNITIKALAGLSNVEIGNLPHSSSFLAGLLPSVSLPIFTSGALRANLSRKEAEFDEQAARYNKNVYTALREAADALTQYETAAAAVRDQTEMTALARKNAAAAQSRYRAGLDNKLDWLAAQDETLQNEAQLAQAQAKLFTAWLALNTAFGGGFASDK